MRVQAIIVLALLIACAALTAVFAQESNLPTESRRPQDLGIVEQTGRRLIQIDVTVTGPDEVIDSLTAEEFQVVVGGRRIEEFTLDRLCMDGPTPAQIVAQGGFEADDPGLPPSPQPPRVSYFFYFDQHHLTMYGRQRAIDLSRDLVRELITGDAQAMIVSSGRAVRVFAEFTSDREVLLEALDRLMKDPEQFDPFAAQEDSRVADVHSALQLGLDVDNSMGPGGQKVAPGSTTSMGRRSPADAGLANPVNFKNSGAKHGMTTARIYQKEERWHTERALARFSTMLGRLEGVDPPKAVIYFADRMRSNAGDHYVAMFQRSTGGGVDPLDPTGQVLAGANLPTYDQVIDTASARGARLYTVQAEGLNPGMSGVPASAASLSFYSREALAGTRRFTDAKNALVGLAAETGGQAFLNGVGPAKIARRIRSDLACVYLISFDVQGLAQDRHMPLIVHVTEPKVTARTRTRLVVESDSTRLTSRLTVAMTNPERTADKSRLRAVVIPAGFANGKYSALVQVQVSGAEYPNAVWDVGLSSLSPGRSREHRAARIAGPEPFVPVILEAELEFAPGPYELIAVAHDVKRDAVISARVKGEWPDPAEGDATVGPIALVQPSSGIFVRGDEHRPQGSLGRGDRDRVRPGLPVALLAIVCRNGSQKRTVEVERRLEGESIAGFPPLAVEPEKQSCFLISDVIPADMMTEGVFRYAVSVRHADEEIAAGFREFIAVAAEEAAQDAAPAANR